MLPSAIHLQTFDIIESYALYTTFCPRKQSPYHPKILCRTKRPGPHVLEAPSQLLLQW